MGESWEDYKSRMARDGTYADELTVRILAETLGHPIYGMMSSRGGQVADRNMQVINESGILASLLLAHFHENHYQSLGVSTINKQRSTAAAISLPEVIRILS